MKRTFTTLTALLLCICMPFGLTACTSQEDINNTVTPLSEQITTINTTLTEMQTLDTTLDGYIDTLETKVTTLETDLTAVNTTLENLEENSATKTALLETKTALETEMSEIREDITVLQTKDTELDGKITALQTALSTEITDTETWIEETFATKTACDTLKTEINTSIATLQGKIDGLETSVATLNTTVTALQTQVEENTNKIEELEIIINCIASGTHALKIYMDCGDGTHGLGCEVCDYVDTSATNHHSMDENCKCTECGAEHYLPYADEGDCFCSYCCELIHNPDENCVCTICSTQIHDVDSTTGICSVCNTFVAAASITVDGVKTYYSTFDEVIRYANGNDSTIIVIENDCNTMDTSSKFSSGNVIIDLNGKTIGSTFNYSICIEGATVTIRDSVGGGKTLEYIGGWGGTLIIEGGMHNYVYNPENLIITGGKATTVSGDSGKVTISGGSFEKISIHKNGGTFANTLADGYCFYDQYGNVVNISNIKLQGNFYNLNNVTVGAIK